MAPIRAGTAYVDVRADLSHFDKDLARVSTRLRERLKGVGKTAAGAAAAYISIAEAKKAVTTTEDLTKATIALHRNLGLTVEEASRWAAVAKARGVDTNALSTSFTALSRAAESARTGSETARTSFARLGIDQKELARGSKDFQFLIGEVAAGMGKMEGGTRRAAIAQQLLGRSSQNTLPIFTAGRRSLEQNLKLADKYGVTLSGKTVKSMHELAQAQKEGEFATMGLQVAFATHLAPALTDVIGKGANFIAQMRKGKGAGGDFANVLGDMADGAKDVGEFIGPPLKDIGQFVGKHPEISKAAGGMTAIALALKGIKSTGRITGVTDLLGLGKRTLGRGGLPGIASKAAPVPVFVTNSGFGPHAPGVPDKPGAPTPMPVGKPKWFVRAFKGFGKVLWPITATQLASDLAGNPQSGNVGPSGLPVVGGKTPGRAAGGVQFNAKDAAEERRAHSESMALRALRIRSIGREITALEDKVVASRRSAQKLKEEGASERDVSRAEDHARDEAYKLARAKYEMAKAAGEASRKVERLRSEVNRLRSKRISVAVDINIPSLNVRAPGNLTGTGPQGPGARTGDGTGDPGIGKYIDSQVRKKAKAAAKANPMALLGAVGGSLGIVAVGRLLQAMGYQVGENPAFGGVHGVHVPGSLHYSGRAIDVNADDWPGGEPRALDAIYPFLSRLPHSELLWRVKDHFDHLHFGMQRGGLIPGRGNGDKVLVKAEPGEGFINKRAVSWLGGSAAIDAINRMIPRFQKGGRVGRPLAHMRRIWRRAAHLFGQDPASPLPFRKISFADSPFVGYAETPGQEGKGQGELLWPGWLMKEVAHGKWNRTMTQLFLHETAHRFQDPKATNSAMKAEGGAEAFARAAMRRLGLKPSYTGSPYASYVRKVGDKLGRDWVLHGQFGQGVRAAGFQRGGTVGKSIRALRRAGATRDEQRILTAISQAESHGRFVAGDGGSSVTPYQIHLPDWGEKARALGYDLSTWQGAAKMALWIKRNTSTGYGNWTMFNNGQYASHLDEAGAYLAGHAGGGTAEDSPKWNWATMGNKRRSVMNLGGVRLTVGAKRFARLVRRGQIDWKRTKHMRGDKWARKHFPGKRKHVSPPGMTDAGNAFMNAFAEQIGMRSAEAALTPETTDDIAVLQDAVRGWQGWLDWARSQHDVGATTTAATNLKSATDALTELTGAGTSDLAQQRIDIDKEMLAVEQRKVALLESQGPQLLAGLAMFSGDVLGRNAGRNRGFPSFAGVGGLART